MNLVVLGLNYQTAPVAVRERLAFNPDEMTAALAELVSLKGVFEAAIVSTCNRTELYCHARDLDAVTYWLADNRKQDPQSVTPHLYTLQGAEAARHAYRVACGLDSMVVGETQILGQLKDAERAAREAGTMGTLLNGVFQRAFSVAKDVRTRTKIGAASVSMAAASVRLAERIFPTIAECKVLFIGAGEMIELCATHFSAQSPCKMVVANRTLERGQALARELGGEAILLTDLPERIHEFDVVVTSTAAPLPIVGKGMIERALKARRRRPMFIVDLAVPRDVESEVGELEDAYLYTVDDLAQVVQQGMASRGAEVASAEAMVNEKVHEFNNWLASRAMVPTIRDLRDHADRLARTELQRAQKKLANGEDPQLVIEQMAQLLSNKFLHAPLAALNNAQPDEQETLVNLVRRLYRLQDID
ncbi:glutamyl-tRNA reductase [Chitinibacter bivalviorum]|uniref:Glutamyl-tRNA reductase n=1 Tax=Chitinibacter bivalviorum TaxID=2739434 RepID=A0A7H9BJK9_9NEIS|nr:glutamyl-tRNA reductase [Chitinibacter bivalviorum]QLG88753.1 glutamyl-tRNA reductase [Chitinibacter bivalviorum]